MHADLVAISNVWQADSTIDRLKAEHEALSGAIVAAREALAARTAEQTKVGAEIDEVRKIERANGRELDGYVQKRNTTRQMIDGGSAPDYGAAVRQLESCTALVDELETKGLELLERLDELRAAQANAAKAVQKAESELKDAQAALSARDAALRQEMAGAIGRRDAALKELPVDYRTPYAELRRKKRVALVNVVEGACSACHMRIPPQKIVEVQMGRAVHTCPGCAGYILP
jgi:hypothetical protein